MALSLSRDSVLRHRRSWAAKFGAICALLIALRAFAGQAWGKAIAAAADSGSSADADATFHALQDAVTQISKLDEEVSSGKIVAKFGERAGQILSAAKSRAGPSGAVDLLPALAGALQPLFLRQASQIRQKLLEEMDPKAGVSRPPLDAVAQTEKRFREQLTELVPANVPSEVDLSGWSIEPELKTLKQQLERRLRLSAALAEEKARSAKSQRAMIRVISKLQDQMELLAQKVSGFRSDGSPWTLSTSYRIPSTPLQLVGRYEQGRATVELNLTPDKDPAVQRPEGGSGLAEGFGPATLGVSFDLGF